MKGRIVTQLIHAGILDKIHGGGHYITRVVVDGLALAVENNYVYVTDPPAGEVNDLGEVEVPDLVVHMAHVHRESAKQINAFLVTLSKN